MKPTIQRQMHAKYTLLRAELFQVDRKIETNMDAAPGVRNPEATDTYLRKQRDKILRKMIGFRR